MFTDPGYDLGLVPGFPDDFDDNSSKDRDLAKRAMRLCDESMSFLTGPELSVGTLKSIVDEVDQDGLDRMPGYCVSIVLKEIGAVPVYFQLNTVLQSSSAWMLPRIQNFLAMM